MSWLDLIIIYFACGTPFAVYRIALSEDGVSETAVRGIWAALLWPVDGGKATLKRLRSASRSLTKQRTEVIRVEMEKILAGEIQPFRHFDFREVFDRYAGLGRALSSPVEPTVIALFDIADIESTAAAEACLRRTIRAKIDRHATAARNELVQYITASSSPRIFELAASLADDLADASLTAELSRHPMEPKKIRPASVRLSGSAS